MMSNPAFSVGYLIGLFGVVALGAVVPVVPTGAAVSAGAALAGKNNLLLVLAVVVFGAAGAYVGDLGTYAVLRFESPRVVHRLGWVSRWLNKPREHEALALIERRIERHPLRTLLLSRLVPGGQTPVLLAAAVAGYPWRRYAVADVGAATLWSALYAATGVLGRAVFPQAWEGVTAGIALVVLISLVSALWSRRRHRAARTEA
jgi:membrane protein DedA with SNARE-associated domain